MPRAREMAIRPGIEQVDVDRDFQTIFQNIRNTAFEFVYDVDRTMKFEDAIAFAAEAVAMV